jgi:phage-related protein
MISVNGIDLGALGFVAQTRRLPRLAGQASTVVDVPGAIGSLVVGGAAGAGRMTVDGTIVAPDRQTLLSRIDELSAALQGTGIIRLSDYPGREWHGIFQRVSAPVEELAPQWTSRAARATLEWLLPDPTAVATVETILAGPTALLKLGTAPSPIAVDVQATYGGPISKIVVEVLAGTDVLRSLTWTGSLTTPSRWRIDDESYAVTVNGANAIGGLSAESTFPEADPAERADRVVVTVTGGEAQVVVRYHKRWW